MVDDGAGAGLLVVTPGWSGERVLVRLLSATGAIRVVGRPLARATTQPVVVLRERLRSRGITRPCALVTPLDISLMAWADPIAVLTELAADGVVVLSLHRASAEDRGLSRAVCGPEVEVLPPGPMALDAAEVIAFRDEGAEAAGVIAAAGTVVAERLLFEDDLEVATGRQAAVERIARTLGLDPWPAPPEHEIPARASLWARVSDPAALRAGLDGIAAVLDA